MSDSGDGARLLEDRERRFEANYNRESFAFAHGLSGHPLFELDSLVALSRRLPAHSDYAYWSNGAVDVADRWEARGRRDTLQQTIAKIATNDSLVMLKHVQSDAVFGRVVKPLIANVVALCGAQMRDDVIIGRATLLIASPRRVTAYHIDADTNFLFQLTGNKTLSTLDQTDRALLSDEELERYHAGDFNGARFDAAREPHARRYALGPGAGVHIPSTAPHWARNGDNVSVALSLNYDLRSMVEASRIYRVNHRLRKLGLRPLAPGTSPLRDSMKLATLSSIEALRSLASRH